MGSDCGYAGGGSGRPNVHAKILVFEAQGVVWSGSYNATANGARSVDQVTEVVVGADALSAVRGIMAHVHDRSDAAT